MMIMKINNFLNQYRGKKIVADYHQISYDIVPFENEQKDLTILIPNRKHSLTFKTYDN